MSTSPIVTITDELLAEIEAAADAFPDYEWDSNQTEFFNGPSGESLGGESTGFYCVYGPPFEIDDDMYDGPTLVEACPLDQARFICEAKPAIKSLLAHIADLKQQLVAASITAENCELFRKDAERYQWLRDDAEFADFETLCLTSLGEWGAYIDAARSAGGGS